MSDRSEFKPASTTTAPECKGDVPTPQLLYGAVVYWITMVTALIAATGPALALIYPESNVLNPAEAFSAIFSGSGAAEVWARSREGAFPGGHFWLEHPLTADGFTQFGLALASSAALPALVCSSFAYLKTRSYGYAMMSLWVAAMVLFAALGVVGIH